MNANTHRRLECIEGKLRSEAPALSEHFITIVAHDDEIGFIVMRVVSPKPQPAQEIRIPTHRPRADRSELELAAALMAERGAPSADLTPRRTAKPIRTTMTMDEFAPLGSGRGTSG